jgi:ribosome-binding protein aMBF1 (putative translation factor)
MGSQRFDRELFSLKLSELSREMRAKSVAFNREAGTGGSALQNIVDGQLGLLRDEWVTGIDRIAREVWETQGEATTPDFVRDVLAQEAMTLIEARLGTIRSIAESFAGQTHLGNLGPVQRHLIMETNRLKSQIATGYEIEVRELEYRRTRTEALPLQAQPPASQPVDQRENLRDGILKKKSRIAEIERILNCPPVTEHRGQPVHGGENWRLRLEEEKQHGLIAIVELEAEMERQRELSNSMAGGSEWQEFHTRFMQFATEEERIEQVRRKDRLLRAYCGYREHPEVWEKGKPEQGCFCLLKTPETGVWTLGDGVSENFLERFRALAARAGVALGPPEDTDPEDFWLHRLWLDLRENKSEQLFAASEEGGVILRVCEASATFCSRLERKAVTRLRTGDRQVESPRAQNSANSGQSTSPYRQSESTYAAAPNMRQTTAVGRNIDRLRKECGWSLDRLADETGMGKKLILSHVNKGARPIPRILKEYAEAFSKALGRKIIAPDLEK